jgi:outer membrane protein
MQRNLIGLLTALAAVPAWSQEMLSIQQAIDRALKNNSAIEAQKHSADAAAARVRAAEGARLPRVNYTESWTRSNNQVFVFGSLLTQKQFTSANFDIRALNEPPFLNNFQSLVTLDQTLYDFGRRQSDIKAAELGRQVAGQEQRKTEMQVIGDVIRSYYGILSGQAAVDAARQTVRSAEADLERAQNRLNAGFITDADVLALKVHVAAMREVEIRAQAALDSARAALNQVMGDPLDTQFQFTTRMEQIQDTSAVTAQAEQEAAKQRPEVREAELGVAIADAQTKAAKSALLPEFFFRAGFEADRQRFVTRGGANWLAAAGMRWTLFSGNSDRAKVSEAAAEAASRRAMAKYAASGAQVETRRAVLELRAADQRVQVASDTIAMAEESLRIVKNRYEGGLADVTELIRSETALAGARMRYIDAVRDQRLAVLAVESASGTLSRDSRAIQ